MNKDKIVDFLDKEAYRPLPGTELAAAMNVGEKDWPAFFDTVRELEAEGTVVMNRKGRYGLCRHMNLIPGTLQGSPKGFGFFLPDDKGRDDIYIPFDHLNGAMHNDKVLVRIMRTKKNVSGREEGEVIRILHHANEQIVGIYEDLPAYGFVNADENRIYQDVFIPQSCRNGAVNGDRVVVEITRWPEKRRNPEGKVIEILGQKDAPGVDILTVIRKYQLPEAFPEKVLREASALAKIEPADYEGRRDLRDALLVTMDGADAKDLDDAVSLEKLRNGNSRLGVHIADVGHYVKFGTKMDREALQRGTSVYLPDRVIPMLPTALSNEICSLNPQVDRLALSCVMEINGQGQIVDSEIFESVIHIAERMTYEAVNEMLYHDDRELKTRYAKVLPMIEDMDGLRETLRRRRFKRGALDFDFPEAKVILDERGKPIEIKKRVQLRAEQIIEEFMIVANETVAETYFQRDVPFIYRVHEKPREEKILELQEFLGPLGFAIKESADKVRPQSLQKLLEEIKEKPEERLISTVVLRSMQHARYDTENMGHFGLASSYYSHFTSPIRRYPDLAIHRVIKDMIHEPHLGEEKGKKLQQRLTKFANQSSLRERIAEEAEREAVDVKMVQYMAEHLDEEFPGFISGVTSFGFFVELDNTVNGLVHVSTLEDDYYEYHENRQCLVGQRGRKIFKLGDKVRVKVTHVNIDAHLIDFEFLNFEA